MKNFIQKEKQAVIKDTQAVIAYYKQIPPYITQSASLFRSLLFLIWKILKVTSKLLRFLLIIRWLLFKIINYFAKKIYDRYLKNYLANIHIFSEFQNFIRKHKDEFLPVD